MVGRSLERKIFAVSALIFAIVCSSPISAKSHDYPMRLQVIHSRWHGRHGWINGYGHGNLMTGQPGAPPKQGMDFEYSCSTPVRHTFAPDTYPARYGKNNLEVVVLLPELGSEQGKGMHPENRDEGFCISGRSRRHSVVRAVGGRTAHSDSGRWRHRWK